MQIKFSTDNAAFEDNEAGELQTIFNRIVIQVENGDRSGVIVDTNGNRVGRWSK